MNKSIEKINQFYIPDYEPIIFPIYVCDEKNNDDVNKNMTLFIEKIFVKWPTLIKTNAKNIKQFSHYELPEESGGNNLFSNACRYHQNYIRQMSNNRSSNNSTSLFSVVGKIWNNFF